MSYSNDLLIDAPIERSTLAGFLARECAVDADKPNPQGIRTFSRPEFYGFLSEPSLLQLKILAPILGFTPSWHIACYFSGNVDPHPPFVLMLQLILIEYECNLAWLGECSHIQLIKRNDQVTIQGNHSPYSHWADYLDKIAKEIGLPYETKKMSDI